MGWKPKNFRESLVPLQIMFAIIGHSVFTFPVGRQRPVFSLIYAIIVTSLYCVALGFALDFCFNSSWFGSSEMILMYSVYVNATIAGLAQILSWHRRSVCCIIGAKITKVDETLHELGATFNYNRTFNNGIGVLVFWLIAVVGLNGIGTLWLFDVIPLYQIIILVAVLHHPFHINSLIVFYFTLIVRIIGLRFRKANELLENIATPIQPSITDKSSAMSTLQFMDYCKDRKDLIQIIKHTHLELVSISNALNEAYGVHMVLELTAYFVMFTAEAYNLYTVIMNPTLHRRKIRIAVLLFTGLAYFAKLIIMNQTCEEVTAEAHQTGDIIHSLHDSVRDPELTDEIKQFSLQITQDALFFSPAGVVTLGHRFILGFLGTLATYLMIFMDSSGDPTYRKGR